MAYRLEELKNVKILKRDLNEVLRYTHLEIKNNTIDENRISHEEIDSIFVSLRVAKSLSHDLRGLIENFKSILRRMRVVSLWPLDMKS